MNKKITNWHKRVGAELFLRKAGATSTKKGKKGYNRKSKHKGKIL